MCRNSERDDALYGDLGVEVSEKWFVFKNEHNDVAIYLPSVTSMSMQRYVQSSPGLGHLLYVASGWLPGAEIRLGSETEAEALRLQIMELRGKL